MGGICVVVMTDGRRDYIGATVASIETNIRGPITTRLIHDDSGDADHHDWLKATFPQYDLVVTPGRSGFGGAYQHAWRHLAGVREHWIFSTEDDFTIDRLVDLSAMQGVLRERPHVAQMALRRQAWSGPEIQAGGVVELAPQAYEDQVAGDLAWLEHRQFWTTNPSLFHADVLSIGWPDGDRSEAAFAARLFSDPDRHAAYWGRRDGGPWVTHTGNYRHPEGTGY